MAYSSKYGISCITSLSAEFIDGGNNDWPPVGWNGEVVSGGGSLNYCHDRTECKFKCTSDSVITPSFYINGGCYPIGEVPDVIKGGIVERSHPNYTIVHNCTSGLQLRCVYSEDQYSPGYATSEFNNGWCYTLHMHLHTHTPAHRHICTHILYWIQPSVHAQCNHYMFITL